MVDPKESKQQRFERLEKERLLTRQYCMLELGPAYHVESLDIWYPPKYCMNTALHHGRCRHHEGM